MRPAKLTMADPRYPPEYTRAVEASASTTLADLPPAVRALDAPKQPPVQFLVSDLLPAGEIVLFVGDGGAFKSSAALHVAGAVAGGYAAFGTYATTKGPILVVSNEDSLGIVIMRLEAYCKGHGWDRETVLGNTYIIADGEPNLSEVTWRFHLVKEVERIKPVMVILDPWFEVLGADENSNTETRPAIKFLRSLAKAHKCVVAVVHHAGKVSQDKRKIDTIRGASSLPHASRAILYFEFLPDGVRVENVKMSRSERLAPFVIKRHIEHEQENRAQWTSARLTIADARTDGEIRAEEFVVAQLRSAVKPLTSSDIRKLASGSPGIRNEELSRAMTRLNAVNTIAYDEGKQGSKLWRLVDRSWSGRSGGNGSSSAETQNGDLAHSKTGKVGQPPPDPVLKLAHLAQSTPGQPPEALRPPLKGGRKTESTGLPSGQGSYPVGPTDPEDIAEGLLERQAIQDEPDVD